MTQRNLRVCHITSVHPAFDIRIFYKECISLAKAGYDVTLIARHHQPETVDNIRVVPFPVYKNRLKRMVFVHFKMFSLALKQKAKLYHFHDPELIPVGIMLKLCGKKVIYDVHEDVPRQILSKEWLRWKTVRKFAAFVVKGFEKLGVLFFDCVVAATSDIAGHFNPRKTILARNFPVLANFNGVRPVSGLKKEKPVLIYAGKLTRNRGIKELVDAMANIDMEARLWLLGGWENPKYREECQNSTGWRFTVYYGSFKPGEVYTYMKASDIGMCMLYPTRAYLTSLPVKAFEYMACDLPIIMSNFPFWENLFKDFALFADPRDPGDIAAKIDMLLKNRRLKEQKGKNGRAIIEEKYSWEKEQEVLIDKYNTILKKENS